MASYTTPGVYIEDVKSGSSVLSSLSSSVGAMIGATRSGKMREMVLVTSFTEFIQEFANGLETPFMADSYLPYAVHGFFANGGKYLYVGRIAHSTATKASKATGAGTESEPASNLTITAANEGAWGNDIKLDFAENEDYNETATDDKPVNLSFDVTISVGNSDSVTITDVKIEDVENKILSNGKAKYWIGSVVVGNGAKLMEETIQLAGGVDGVSDLTNTDYTDNFDLFSAAEDATLIAIPGAAKEVNKALIGYADTKNKFPILDSEIGMSKTEIRSFRKEISAFGGCLLYPWGKVNDSLTESLKIVPPSGYYMGVCARTIEERGAGKVPAGVDAVVRSFVDMEVVLTADEVGYLNAVGVICIYPRPNAGIVVWGARSLNPENLMKYVSDVLINYDVKRNLYELTQFAVFEPNDQFLWSRVNTVCKDYLEGLRKQGVLKGTSDEAYFVTVDDTNNTTSTIANGELHIDIGYAPNKPAEFVIIKLAHSIEA